MSKCYTLSPYQVAKNRVTIYMSVGVFVLSVAQVGFAELKADDRLNLGGTIIGTPIVGE